MSAQLVAILILCFGLITVVAVSGLLVAFSRPDSQLSLAQTLGRLAVVCCAFVATSMVLIQTR